MELWEKEVSKEYLFRGKVVTLRHDTVLLPDGTTAKREIIEHSGGVGVLAVDEEDRVYLVTQYRRPYDELVTEIPAGKLEPTEDPEEGAARELLEETGLTAERLTSLGAIYPSPGYCGEIIHIYLAEELKKGTSRPDEGEFLSVSVKPLSEVRELIEKGNIRDAKTVVAVLRYLLMRKEQSGYER